MKFRRNRKISAAKDHKERKKEMTLNPQEIFLKTSFQELRHSGGMTESSPAIYRRVHRRKRARPGGTLEQSRQTIPYPPFFSTSLRSLRSFAANFQSQPLW
jgi:hypothetical protein